MVLFGFEFPEVSRALDSDLRSGGRYPPSGGRMFIDSEHGVSRPPSGGPCNSNKVCTVQTNIALLTEGGTVSHQVYKHKALLTEGEYTDRRPSSSRALAANPSINQYLPAAVPGSSSTGVLSYRSSALARQPHLGSIKGESHYVVWLEPA
jgi:hypothetical protein